MSRHKVVEPSGITPDINDYTSTLSRHINWYHVNVDRKEARGYVRNYIIAKFGREPLKTFDRIAEVHIQPVMGWVARLVTNGNTLKPNHQNQLDSYVDKLLNDTPLREAQPQPVNKPTVRDYTELKAKEYVGELENSLDDFIFNDKEFNLQADMKARAIPAAYNVFIENWLKKKAAEFISVYESTDPDVKEGYSNIGRRKLTQIIKAISQWLEDLGSYEQFKKANRKPRAKKKKPAGVQVAKLKFKREDTELGIKSISPVEIVGAEQVWIYNTKTRKLAAYRSDSIEGIQVKGTSLQNYDPDMCEQKTLRKPAETLKQLMTAGKVQLRRLLSELSTKESPVNGRINEECIILRAIK